MTLLVQAPAPPLPPPVPGSEMSVTGSLDGFAAVAMLLSVGVLVAVLLWPLIKAVARRIESGGGAGAELQGELETLRDRVRQLEEMAPRMAELEERLDFTERVVTQGREPDRLQG